MIEDLLVLAIPMHLLPFAITSCSHHNRHGMGKPGIDIAVRRLPAAHATEPVIGVKFEVVILIQRRHFLVAFNGDKLRLRLAHFQIEDDIRTPTTLGFGDEPPLWAAFATR